MPDREELQREIASLKSDLAELRLHMGDLKQSVVPVAADAEADADAQQSEADNLREKLRTMLEGAKGQGIKAYDAVEHTVQERPILSLGIAFGAGLLLGKLLDRR